MSRENVELVLALLPVGADFVDLFGSEQAVQVLPGGPDQYDDDFEVRFVAEGAELQQITYRGRDGLIEGWREWLEPWASFRVDFEEVIDAGDRVLVLVHVESRTARDGVVMEHSPAVVWTLVDGRVRAVDFYLHREQAFEATGRPGR